MNPTPSTLREIVERLENAAHDLDTALGFARRSAAPPLHRDDIRAAAESVHAARIAALAALAEIEAEERKAAVRAYGMDPTTSQA